MSMHVQTFVNGKIFTSNEQMPFAEAMVVEEGKISWIGSQANVRKKGNVIDLRGRRVLPGLIDAHQHPIMLANMAQQVCCMPPIVHSIDELIVQLQQRLSREPNTQWLEAWGYDEGKLLERRAPTRWDLDRVSTDVPIIVTRTCTHIIAVNSKALELASITNDTSNPSGGVIDRDSDGVATGILRESARNLVLQVMPKKTIDVQATELATLSQSLLSHGITCITELMAKEVPTDDYDLFHRAVEKGLQQRVVLYYMWDHIISQKHIPLFKRHKEQQVYVGGIKLFADGSVSGQTAWVSTPFSGTVDQYGIMTTTKQQLLEAGAAAKSHQLQLVVHAMGDRAIDFIVDTYKEQDGWLKTMPAVRIEHVAMPTEQTLEQAAQACIAFVTQPIFLFAEIESYVRNLGHMRTTQTYPIRAMLEAGIQVALSSDAPATAWADPANPFVGMKAAVTRIAYDGSDTGVRQAIDVATAIVLYTRAAQQITGIPNVGQLAQGFAADFIVLDRDICNIPTHEIDQVTVEQTYIAGQLVFTK